MKLNPHAATYAQLLLSGTLVHEGNLEEIQRALGVDVHPRLVMVVSVDRYPDLAAGKPSVWRTWAGHALADAIADAVTWRHVWSWVEEGVLALLAEPVTSPVAAPSAAGFEGELSAAARRIQHAARQRGLSVSVGIGGVYDDVERMQQSFQEALQAMSGRFFQGNGLIFVYHQDDPADDTWGETLTGDKTEVLARVRIGDEAGLAELLRDHLNRLAAECRYREAVFRSEVVELVLLASRSTVEAGINASMVLTRNTRFIHDLYTTIRFDKFVQKVIQYVQWLAAQVASARLPKASSPVTRQALAFIRQHHTRPLSLDEVARHCCISKYHLSHLFKKEVGFGVIDYLNQIRVENAEFYLETTDWTIQQVASRVGFQDANYFSRIFKKYTKRSPRSYRMARSC